MKKGLIFHYDSFFNEKYRLDSLLFIRMAQHVLYVLYMIQFVHSQGNDHNYKIRFKKTIVQTFDRFLFSPLRDVSWTDIVLSSLVLCSLYKRYSNITQLFSFLVFSSNGFNFQPLIYWCRFFKVVSFFT